MAAGGPQARSSLSPGIQPAAFTPTQKAASGRLDPPRVALFGPSLLTQVQQPDPRARSARGVGRLKDWAGSRGGAGQWGHDPWQNGCQGPQARSGLSPTMQPAAFTPTQKAASGRQDPPHVALFGPSVVTQVQQPDPQAGGAWAWLDPRPGQEEGRGWHTRTCPQAEWLPVSSSPIRPVSRNATSSLQAHSEGCFGEAGPSPRGPFRA